MQSKVALITGAARRIGAEIARVLHENGMNIVVHYHTSKEQAEQLCGELNAKRADSARILQADLSKIGDLATLVTKASECWGRLDVLVNNASRFYKTHIGDVTEKIWDDLLDTNLKAPFFLSQAAAPFLQKTKGCIVNITDIHAQKPVRDYPVYCVSKTGLHMLTKALAKELGPEIRVNSVAPGAIAWPEGVNDLSSELKAKIMNETALRKHGDPNHVAKAVLYLVKDADYVTGEVIAVDGGRLLSI